MSQTTSKFIQLQGIAGNALLEYVYNSDEISTNDANFLRIRNYYSGTLAYVNYNILDFSKPGRLTGNTLDHTAMQISESKWAHLDIDRPLKFWERTSLGATGQPVLRFDEVYREINNEVIVTYDTLRLHLVQGYTFDDIAGVILRIGFLERNGGNQVFPLNFAYLKENDNIHLNPRPIFLGDRVYNRYIEVKVPSLRDLSDANNELGPVFSSDGNGFLDKFPDQKDAKINFIAYEVQRIENGPDGQLYLYTFPPQGSFSDGILRVEIPQVDSYANLAARVQESDDLDGIEFYPLYNGNFIEDFVTERARLGEQILVIHDIELFEHLSFMGDFDEVKTFTQTTFQEIEFDRPNYFRPIIMNSNAVAYTVEYTVRILNRTDNSQIIRRASVTNTNAKKYGRRLTKIALQEGLQPIKVVNKIVVNGQDSRALATLNPYLITGLGAGSRTGNMPPNQIKTVFAPIQISDVLVNGSTLFVNDVGSVILDSSSSELSKVNLEELFSADIIYGQGESVIYLNKFDNFFKFRFYQNDKAKGGPVLYEALKSGPSSKFYMVFENDTGELVRFEAFEPDSTVLLSAGTGELIFRIDGTQSERILRGSNRNYYITMENSLSESVRGIDSENTRKNLEVVMYRGLFDSIDNFQQINNVNYLLKEQVLKDRISQIGSQANVLSKLSSELDQVMGSISTEQLSPSARDIFNKLKIDLSNLIASQ